MRLALHVILIWCLASVPLALLVGKFLRLRNETVLTGATSTDVDVRYWSAAELGGDVEATPLLAFQTGDVRAMQPAQREFSSV